MRATERNIIAYQDKGMEFDFICGGGGGGGSVGGQGESEGNAAKRRRGKMKFIRLKE